MTGPYLVRHLEPGEPARCDAITTRDEQCTLPATVRYVGGPNDGRVDCTRHGNDRDRHRQPIDAPIVVSVKAFETLEPGEDGLQWHVDLLIEELGGSIDEHKDVTADGARLELPGGAILVEETTWDALIDEYVPDAYYALGDDEDSRQVRAELIATANAAMAERYGTEGR